MHKECKHVKNKSLYIQLFHWTYVYLYILHTDSYTNICICILYIYIYSKVSYRPRYIHNIIVYNIIWIIIMQDTRSQFRGQYKIWKQVADGNFIAFLPLIYCFDFLTWYWKSSWTLSYQFSLEMLQCICFSWMILSLFMLVF